MVICEIEFGETKFSTEMREKPKNPIGIYAWLQIINVTL